MSGPIDVDGHGHGDHLEEVDRDLHGKRVSMIEMLLIHAVCLKDLGDLQLELLSPLSSSLDVRLRATREFVFGFHVDFSFGPFRSVRL